MIIQSLSLCLLCCLSVIYAAPQNDSAVQKKTNSSTVITAEEDETLIESINEDLLKSDPSAVIKPVKPTVNSFNDTASVPTTTQKIPPAATIINESEEELILDGGEESLIAPINPQKTISKSDTSDSIGSTQTVTTSPDTSNIITETIDKNSEPLTPDSAKKLIIPPIETVQPLQIEKTKSINFAQNVKNYRSLKAAILLSLLVPGSGQAYAHSYLKTGVFGAIEVALIGASAALGIQGNQRVKDAHSFADKHYSTDNFSDYYKTLLSTVGDSIVQSQIFYGEENPLPFFKNSTDKNETFYKDIGDRAIPYVCGWDDVLPTVNNSFDIAPSEGMYIRHVDHDSSYLVYFINANGDTSKPQFGFSENQKIFNKKITNATTYYRWSSKVLWGLIFNHIASAIDAGITAKAYNDYLLGKESFWQRINIKEAYADASNEFSPGLTLEVRF